MACDEQDNTGKRPVYRERTRENQKTGQKMISMREAIKYVHKHPEMKETIIRNIENTLGDYNNFNKFERDILKRIIPFYSWYRTIFRHTINLAKDNPSRCAMIFAELQKLENDDEDLKQWQKEDLFLFLINKLKPYQVFSQPSKPIRCTETGEVFKNARYASNHIKSLGLSESRSIDATIKKVCKGQRESAFGYHWEFVLDDYKQETSSTKGKKHIVRLKQDLQTIKGRSYTSSHSTSYRLDETSFKNLKNDIEKYSVDLNRQRSVKCIETGRIFFSEHSAGLWIKEQKFVNGYYVNGNNANMIIKDACNGIREKAYGYHWKFADE